MTNMMAVSNPMLLELPITRTTFWCWSYSYPS